MSFDILDRPLLYIPVKWPGLKSDATGGAVATEHTVDIQVEILGREEFAKWIEDANADGVEGETSEARITRELDTFKQVAKGWRKIKANGRALDFKDDNVLKLLQIPGFVPAFGPAYMAAWQGQVETREGNSDGSPGNGPAGEPIGATTEETTPTT